MAQSFAEQWFDFGPNAWLIAYDIADPRRLSRLWRYLKRQAIPVQYSVFLGWLNERELQKLLRGIESRIDAFQDDVRLYHLPSRTLLYKLGRQWLPAEVHLMGERWNISTSEAIGSEEMKDVGSPASKVRNSRKNFL